MRTDTGIGAVCLFWLSWLLGGQAAAAYTATVNVVEFSGPDYVIDVDDENPGALYSRDRIPLRAGITFTRASGDPSVVTFRYAMRLLDGVHPRQLW